MEKRKRNNPQIGIGAQPKILHLSDDEEADDNRVGISQETEDLENQMEEEKTQEMEMREIPEKRNNKSDKQQLIKLSRFDKYLVKFKYCEM
jgi:argininosuccinate synthase